MRKILSFLLASLMIFALAACGSDGGSTQEPPVQTPAASTEEQHEANEPTVVETVSDAEKGKAKAEAKFMIEQAETNKTKSEAELQNDYYNYMLKWYNAEKELNHNLSLNDFALIRECIEAGDYSGSAGSAIFDSAVVLNVPMTFDEYVASAKGNVNSVASEGTGID